ELNTEGLSPNQLKEVALAHAKLRAFLRAYPGLRLGEFLDNPDQTPETKAASVTRRASLIGSVQAKIGEGELFTLDFAPGSPDLARLDLPSLSSSAVEQSLLLGTLKTYQRSYALTRYVDDALHL